MASLGLSTQQANNRSSANENDQWVAVAAGYNHSLALKSDGTLWGWGGNQTGQVGDKTLIDKSTPQQLFLFKTWTSVSANRTHILAVKSDSSLWAWGRNSAGQLGLGSTPNMSVSTPQLINNMGWNAVAAGGEHSLGIKTTGTLSLVGKQLFRSIR